LKEIPVDVTVDVKYQTPVQQPGGFAPAPKTDPHAERLTSTPKDERAPMAPRPSDPRRTGKG